MANQKANQKKRQKKALKRKKKLAQTQPKLQLSKQQLLIKKIERQQSAPVYKCLISHDLLETGFGTALFTRKLISNEAPSF